MKNAMVNPSSSGQADLQKLTSKEEFLAFQKRATDRWTQLWDGPDVVVSVGVGSSSIARGARSR